MPSRLVRAAILLALSALPRVAAASAPLPSCATTELRGIVDAKAVPANLPALALVYRGTEARPTFTLATKDDGASVPANLSVDAPARFLLAPAAPLEPGRAYVVTTPDVTCTGESTIGFTATEAVTFPTTAGTVRVSSRTFDYVVTTGSDDEVPYAKVDATVEPAKELAPFYDTTLFTVTVDGAPYGAAAFPPRQSLGATTDTSVSVHFQTLCDSEAADDGADRGLAEGTHNLAVTARIAGTTTDLPAMSSSFTIDCTGAPSRKTHGGCTSAGHPAGSVAPLAAAIAAASALARRRRRKPLTAAIAAASALARRQRREPLSAGK